AGRPREPRGRAQDENIERKSHAGRIENTKKQKMPLQRLELNERTNDCKKQKKVHKYIEAAKHLGAFGKRGKTGSATTRTRMKNRREFRLEIGEMRIEDGRERGAIN